MFVYEQGNTLNVTFKANHPVENPEVVIKGYKDGATISVNDTTYGSGTEEFVKKSDILVYHKDNKLMITFKGIKGMSSPDIIIDEPSEGVADVTVGTEHIVINYNEDAFSVEESSSKDTEEVEEPVEESKEPEVVIPDVSGDSVEEEEIPEPEEV